MFINLKKIVFCAGLLTIGLGALLLTPGCAGQDKSDRKVIKRVEAAYPPLAAQLHLAGAVKMVLQVTPEGKVTSVHTPGGNPVLASAAEAAVKQWKYETTSKESSEPVTIVFQSPS
jgi:outer membrane biosynthesis protein TonB